MRPLRDLISDLWQQARQERRKRMGTSRVIHTEDGTIIACSLGRSNRRCAVCGRPAPYLCDYPVTIQLGDGAVGRTTCDKPLCSEHARGRGGGKHWCYDHVTAGSEASQAREAQGE